MTLLHCRERCVTILDGIRLEIDPAAVFARLHLDPRGAYAGEIHDLIEKAREGARPRALYEFASVTQREDDAVVITAEHGGTERQARFVSRVLRAQLDTVDRVFAYLATCGHELDAIPIAADDVFGQFCLDAIKEMALYIALGYLLEHLKNKHGLETPATMNPGSGECSVWPIEQQRELFAFLADGPAALGVTLTDSCLMIPNKTVSGVFFPCQNEFQTCQLCRQERCPNRRAPFDPHLWEEHFCGA